MTLATVGILVDAETQLGARPEEVRRHPRQDIEATVDFVSESNFYGGLSENVSAGGIFVATFAHASIGEHVRIRFALPDEDALIEAEAEVRWLRLYNSDAPDTMPGMGLRFTEIASRDVQRIAEFIQAREPLFYDED